MAAIISEKFRIFNAKQFLESLSEGSSDTGGDRSRMYFFVGRPQAWDSFLEITSVDGTDSFAVGDGVYVGANWATATFKATVSKVLENSLLLSSIGPLVTDSPALGSTLTGYNQGTNADKLVTATTGVYRFSTENIPPVPLDNQSEKFDIYDDIIAAKRITSSYARHVIRRYNWDLINNPKFDMYKPDYFATPAGGGQIGKTTATGATSLANAKFYIMNQNYEVFKCLYNGEDEANPSGVNIAHEPKTNPQPGLGSYSAGSGIYTAPDNSYIWKYMYTIPTDDVLAFLSTDFMPINAAGETTRTNSEAAATNGAVEVAIVPNKGTLTSPVAGTFYAPVVGDGVGAVAELTITGGEVTAVSMMNAGSGYTYGSIPFVDGVPFGTNGSTEAIGLFSDSALTVSEPVTATDTPAIEPIMSPQGGHNSDMEMELNSKRVMTNIRLTFIENAGDFPVDNDFRRIGIIKDPYEFGTTTFATADTLNALKAVKVQNATGDYIPDEMITQTVAGGSAYGQVVSWTLDAGSPAPTPGTPGSGVLKYIQTPYLHKDNGVVRLIEPDAANAIVGSQSGSSGNVETGLANGTELIGSIFVDGLASPELENNSGDLVYIENRRLITRAADQIEDIKLVIEF
ncbi:baseplate wedge [Synechococcus phage S-CAM3]|uniref:Baseplate wedge n=1 Tax=Synechococcus phage S-CAM3 TaxID=1883366 RepID=A0A1D8KK84_9CAUD|nr:baseplate wedge subunit [Synechococcus phage S-CAM3]AOV58591.1 baseplate wedge [Synechococcus phage S-CAM3]AOV58830.1 baseplate wedge [Synechococcus phage S-CAM3]AOV59069.1 baseplate wedge [Synechococcus phage S-CAM3]